MRTSPPQLDPFRLLAVAASSALAVACATPSSLGERSLAAQSAPAEAPIEAEASPGQRSAVVHGAESAIGAPYVWGGASPAGFDCSGLVLYSYAQAGVNGLPHSAAALYELAEPIALEGVAPGDLLFFALEPDRDSKLPSKTSHVGIYVGDRSFVHAPSAGKHVERTSVDHVYWSTRIRRAGRLLKRGSSRLHRRLRRYTARAQLIRRISRDVPGST